MASFVHSCLKFRKGYSYRSVFVRSVCNLVSPVGSSARSIYARVSPLASSWNSNCFYGSSPARQSLASNDTLQPWLMLPPESSVVEGSSTVTNSFKFYNLTEKKVVSVPSLLGTETASIFRDIKHDDMCFVGSSHGWLAMFHQRSYNLFLFNPLSGRRINLPRVDTLPRPQEWAVNVNKVILSCSPEQEDCQVMICYSVSELAICRLGHSTQWTPIGNLCCYEDFVFSDKLGAFLCFTREGHFELWSFPREDHHILIQHRAADKVLKGVSQKLHYLVALPGGDFLLVSRLSSSMDDTWIYQTVGFHVYRYNVEERSLRYVDHIDAAKIFNGMALFIGINHSFAVSSPLLRPNSIYFTDGGVHEPYSCYEEENDYGGHDIGIFDYQDQTFESCYYPRDISSIKKIIPKPIWFTPAGN